jgi:glycosyltransferase involved in cell wall biosynthesis
MIVVHLLPFPFRGMAAPHLWVFYKAITHLGDAAVYWVSQEYLVDPREYARLGRSEPTEAGSRHMRYEVPSAATLGGLELGIVPKTIEAQFLAESGGSWRVAWQRFLTSEVKTLVAWYRHQLDTLVAAKRKPEAIITWCNCPSLQAAARAHSIPVVHAELGALRRPDYLLTTYFDRSGVNGNTEAAARYKRWALAEQPPPYSCEQLRKLFRARRIPPVAREYRIGVPLQVEDDSNVVAFANGFDNQALINLARTRATAHEVLVRSHPASQFRFGGDAAVSDTSPTTAHFIAACREILTINSSVGVEALLYETPVQCVGDAPYSFVTDAEMGSEEFLRRMNFFCLNYLVPETFLFDLDYLRWRLQNPPESEIRQRHLAALRQAAETHPPAVEVGVSSVPFAAVMQQRKVRDIDAVRSCSVLYYAAENEPYAEERTVSCELLVGAGRHTLYWPLPAGVNRLRLDPAEMPCVFTVEQAFLLDAEGKALWSWFDHRTDMIANPNSIIVRPSGATKTGIDLVCFGTDPHCDLVLSAEALARAETQPTVLVFVVHAARMSVVSIAPDELLMRVEAAVTKRADEALQFADRLAHLETDLRALAVSLEERESHRRTLQEMENAKRDLSARLEQMQAQRNQLEARVGEAVAEAERLQAELDRTRRSLADVESRNAQLLEEARALRARQAEQERDLVAARETLRELQRQLDLEVRKTRLGEIYTTALLKSDALASSTAGGRSRVKGLLPLPIQPIAGVLPGEDEPNLWLALDNDPQFEVGRLETYSGEWVRITIDIELEGTWSSHPVLYFDCGFGFSELDALVLPQPGTGESRIDFVFNVPRGLVRTRFDPLGQAGRFRLGIPLVQRLRKPSAGLSMARELARQRGWQGVLHSAARALLPAPTPWRIRAYAHQLVTDYQKLKRDKPRSYTAWIAAFEPSPSDYPALKLQQQAWPWQPLISVVMPVYNTPPAILRATIESVRAQVYANWQLCIADDASTMPHVRKLLENYARQDTRIRVAYRESNGHIVAASNSALELAAGDFIALLDHDDLLHPLALHYVAEAIALNPDAGLVYTDEDKIDGQGNRYAPYFKCEMNYELMLSQNMICHLAVYRRSLFEELGGFREGFEGAQDYDLALRVIERLTPEQIVHIPRVLYHWRAMTGSTALSADEKPYAVQAARKAVAEHLSRRGLRAEVLSAPEAPAMNRVRFALPEPTPLVSIIIPTRDRADLLSICVDSILAKTTYPNFEIIIVDNGSVEPTTFALFARLPESRVRILRDESPFNFSALNNRAAREARGAMLCLMNNDIEIVTPDWLEEMVSFAALPDVGAVGARLWYPDGRLQHGGVVLGVGGVAGHSHKFVPRGKPGYFCRAVLHQAFSAVTAACLVVRKSIFEQVGGLDEELEVAFNDIDFCLRVRQAGYRNVWTPFAEMIHHESASRGHETTPDKQRRFQKEITCMRERWQEVLRHDPAYSPNLTLEAENFDIAWPPRLWRAA